MLCNQAPQRKPPMMRIPIAAGAAGTLLLCFAAIQWPTDGSPGPAVASSATTESAREFARLRNAESDASIARVQSLRAAELARQRQAASEAVLARAKARHAALAFERQRNSEIDASIARVEAKRAAEFARQRNA